MGQDISLEHVGTGGVLLRWADADAIPADADIFSDGVHVARQPLVRFLPENAPAVSLIDTGRFLAGADRFSLIEGQAERMGWGSRVSDDWSVEGEDTPFCYRELVGDHSVSRYDLTAAAGLDHYAPAQGDKYRFSCDLAQHRCGVGLAIEWIDRWGQVIDRREGWRETGPLGGRSPAGYEAFVVGATCPPGAVHIRLSLLQGPPTEGADAFVFLRRPQLVQGRDEDRPVVELAGVPAGADVTQFAMLPVGDVLDQFAGPFSVVADGALLDLPDLDELVSQMGEQVLVTVNGGYLDINLPAEGGEAPTVYVVIDGKLRDFVPLEWHGSGAGASLRLPDALLDGNDHLVEVRGAVAGETLHAGCHRTSAFMTPIAVLQQYTSRIERPGVLPLARYRYEALDAAIERLGRAGQVDGAVLAEINRCHRYLLGGPQPDQAYFEPRTLPAIDRPLFSIVVPVHNKFYFTYFCLTAILYSCAGLPYEVVVVDDGSSDLTRDISAIIANVRVVRHDVATGFVGACNAGAAAACGDYIVFLNNDTEVTGRWLEELHLPFESFSKVGLTGAMLLYPDGRLQEAGCIVWNNGHPWNYGRDGNPADPAYAYTRQVDYMSGAAIMVSREAWETVGGFSREFAPAYYEDTDLAFKLRHAGYRSVYAAKSPVIHYEGVSNGTATSGEGLKRFQEINRPKFEAKWRRAFRFHAPEGVRPELEKDRGQSGRALVLDYQPPRFDKDAGSYAISQEIRIIQALGYKVTLAPANCAHLGMYTEAFERAGVEHLHAPFYSSLHEVLERRGEEFGLIYIHRYTTAEGIIEAARHYAPAAKILVNCADLHFLREIRAARVSGSQEAFDAALKRRRIELEVLGQADGVLTYSESEKAVLESHFDFASSVQILPWVVEAAQPRPLAERSGLAFLGSFDHPPNRDAVDYFLAECWPRISAANPGVTFTIAGSGFDRFVPKTDDPSVKVIGWVEDAQAFLASQRVMVAPLRSGAGVKGKVFDSLACGTPAVLSPVAAEGIAAGSVAAPVARTAEDWARHISRLLGDDSAWESASRAALGFIESGYSFAAGIERFERIFESVDLPFVPQVEGIPSEAFAPTMAIRDMHKARQRAERRPI